jgi:uncharacterized protein YutE (UPF0331/DUF86 family)
MTIDELKQQCESETKHIDRVINELFSVYTSDKSEYTLAEQASIAALLMNVYSGIENILKHMLVYDRIDVGDAPEWHEKVLRKASEMGIVPPDLLQILSRYLAFRNYFVYNYVFSINWEDMKTLVDALHDVIEKFKTEVDEYIQAL